MNKENFFTYPLGDVLKLSNTHSIHIYGLLRADNNLVISPTQLLSILGETESMKYEDLRSIIITVQKELDEKSILSFTFNELSNNRSVTNIQFIVNPMQK